jgi:manganese transport protein
MLVVSAIVVGNGAYQSGNISGASLGLVSVAEQLGFKVSFGSIILPIMMGSLAFVLLITGSYKVIE